jgi:hypothetical protein
MKSDVKSHTLEQNARDKRLTSLMQKSGIYGERFTEDDLKRIQEGNGKYLKNGSENLSLAIYNRNEALRSEQDKVADEKRRMNEHMQRVKEEETTT